MNCETMQDAIDGYLDDSLDPATRDACDAHLAVCDVCRSELQSLEALRAHAASLRREIEPPRDLWVDIRARIQPGAQSPTNVYAFPVRAWLNFGLVAAAVVIVFAFGIYIGRSEEQWTPPSTVSAQPSPESAADTYKAAEAEYARARDQLLEMLRARKDAMNPETYAVIEENLRIVDQAIGEIRIALNTSPGDPQLTELLFAAYRTQVEMLQDAERLTAQS